MSLALRALRKSSPALLFRSFHISRPVENDGIDEMIFKINGYNKYGLLSDDFLPQTVPEVAEALRRLPIEQRMQRSYRIIRAMQADMNHEILPEDQWTKFSDPHYYLHPYLEEIRKENEEMEDWEANH